MESNHSSELPDELSEHAQQQLRLLHQLYTNHSSAFTVKGLDHRYLVVNDLFAELLQLKPEQIIGKNDLELGVPEKIIAGDPGSNTPGIRQLDDLAIENFNSVPSASGTTVYPANCSDFRMPLVDHDGETYALATVIGDKRTQKLQKELDVRNDQLIVLHSLMADLLSYQEPEPLLQKIAEIMTEHTAAEDAVILLVDETSEFIEGVACNGPTSGTYIGIRREHGAGFAGKVWATGETSFITNSSNVAHIRDYWPPETQLLGVPLKVEDKVIGAAVLGAPSTSPDLSKSTTVVDNLASIASFAIATAESLEKSKIQLRQSRGLSEISAQLTSIGHVDELLLAVPRKLVESFGFSRSTIFQVTSDRDLYSKKTWTKTIDGIEAVDTLPKELLSETSIYWCYRNNEEVFIPRKTNDPRESDRIHKIRADLNIGCTVAMPIVVSDKVFGVLFVSKDQHKSDCDENELNLLSSIVKQLSTAIYGIKAAEALHRQAYHDSLTELPNRRYFEDELKRHLLGCNATDKTGTLMFLDLDGFKQVNDSAGHGIGDQLLQMVSKRLNRNVPDNGLIARIGGDEFAVIIPSINSEQDVFKTAQQIRKSVLDPFKIGNTVANIGTSIGVCFFPTDGNSVDVLLRYADEAMYQAKSNGKNNVVRFEAAMATNATKKIRIEAEMHHALDREEFLLHYQPQVDPVDGRVKGVEALVRWLHPERGMIPPADFVPIAEETRMINEIGSWVLKEAISQLSQWQNTRMAGVRVSVNIAAAQFLHGDFTTRIYDLLSHYNVPAEMLEVELTESVVMNDIEHVAERLSALKKIGVTVALDDFGTGYSSLSYLQDLPIDVLKIDRAFVANLNDINSDHSIVKTIMLLASGLGLDTVAEGVETSNQLDQIVNMGCALVQGFYYSKPCSVVEIEDAVARIEEEFSFRQAS